MCTWVSDSRWRSRRWAITSLALATGCADLIGADDYVVEAPAPVGTALGDEIKHPPDSGTPESHLPYLTGETCEPCVVERCEDAERHCRQDDFCAAWLESMRSNPDPLSAYSRYRLLTNEMWERLHGGEDSSVLPIELMECTTTNCRTECDLGRDFSCVGAFDWRVAFPDELRTRMTDLGGLPPSSPWSVQACSPEGATCPVPLGATTTEPDGTAQLVLDGATMPYPEFGGFLLWSGGADYHEWATFVSRPFASGDYTPYSFAEKAVIDFWYEQLGEAWDSESGYVWVQPFDCRGLAAKGVQLHLQLAGAGGPEPCTSCVYTYENSQGIPDVQWRDFSSAGRIGFVSFVPAQQVILTLRPTDGDEVLAVQTLSVAPGRIHFVKLYPASRSQLANAGR